MDWSKENLLGIKFDRPWKWLLMPGVVLLWLSYMFPRSGISATVASSRHARSPIMTIAYSGVFYLAFFIFLLISLFGK